MPTRILPLISPFDAGKGTKFEGQFVQSMTNFDCKVDTTEVMTQIHKRRSDHSLTLLKRFDVEWNKFSNEENYQGMLELLKWHRRKANEHGYLAVKLHSNGESMSAFCTFLGYCESQQNELNREMSMIHAYSLLGFTEHALNLLDKLKGKVEYLSSSRRFCLNDFNRFELRERANLTRDLSLPNRKKLDDDFHDVLYDKLFNGMEGRSPAFCAFAFRAIGVF